MASAALADHDTSNKTFEYIFKFRVENFGLFVFCTDLFMLVRVFFWLEFEAVSGKRVAVVGAGVR